MAEDIVERLPVRARHYEYSDPFSGKSVWRNEGGTWNGQQPKGSVELYDRQTVELAITAQREELDRVREALEKIESETSDMWAAGIANQALQTKEQPHD